MTVSAGKETKSSARRVALTDEERWRLERFAELKFMADDALRLAVAGADYRQVALRLAQGCTHEQALRIFV